MENTTGIIDNSTDTIRARALAVVDPDGIPVGITISQHVEYHDEVMVRLTGTARKCNCGCGHDVQDIMLTVTELLTMVLSVSNPSMMAVVEGWLNEFGEA